MELVTVHTADLTGSDRRELRALLDAVFERMNEDAFDNALGGIHAMVYEDDALIGHASVVARHMVHGGRTLRAGYIESVAVRAGHRRRGHGDAMMAELERVVRSAYDLGALGASPDGARLYASRGWQRWRGPSAALTPDGIRPTPDKDGYIYVLPVADGLDLDGQLICGWRPGNLW